MVYYGVNNAGTTTFNSNPLSQAFYSYNLTLTYAGLSTLPEHIHKHVRDRHVGDQADMAVYGMNTEYNKGNIV